jgi:hypothetical protein
MPITVFLQRVGVVVEHGMQVAASAVCTNEPCSVSFEAGTSGATDAPPTA